MLDTKSIGQPQSKSLSPPQQLTARLSTYNLKLDLAQRPIPSIDSLQLQIANRLGKSPKTTKEKLNAFIQFIKTIKSEITHITKSIKKNKSELMIYNIEKKRNGFDQFGLFCLLFNLRVEFYFLTKNRLSMICFGLKEKKTFYLLNFDNNYYFLNPIRLKKQQHLKTVIRPFVKKNPTPFIPRSTTSLTINEVSPNSREDTLSIKKSSPIKKEDSLIAKCRTMASLESSPKSSPQKHTGRLKFYNEVKEYGFILFDSGGEIFIHKTDLQQSNVNTAQLDIFDKFYSVRVEFEVRNYRGKSKGNRKAINIKVLQLLPKGN